ATNRSKSRSNDATAALNSALFVIVAARCSYSGWPCVARASRPALRAAAARSQRAPRRRPARSGADGVPGRLELEEVPNRIKPLRRRGVPGGALEFREVHPLDALRGAKSDRLSFLGIRRRAD